MINMHETIKCNKDECKNEEDKSNPSDCDSERVQQLRGVAKKRLKTTFCSHIEKIQMEKKQKKNKYRKY